MDISLLTENCRIGQRHSTARHFVRLLDQLSALLAFQKFIRDSKVPNLAVWGRGVPTSIPAGAEAYCTTRRTPTVNGCWSLLARDRVMGD